MGSYRRTIARIMNERSGRDVLRITRGIRQRRAIRNSQRQADYNISQVVRGYK